jgi:hypothetical protein
MTAGTRIALLFTIAMTFVRFSPAQQTRARQSEQITVREPGVYELAGLFKQADTVALVKIVAGDSESYRCAVYKAEVLKNFKGAKAGEVIYFGPYVGQRLGLEYVLFLRNAPDPIAPNVPGSAFGRVHYAEVFNEGYSSMEVSYECVFGGRDIAQQCDYGVRVCTDYIKLPKGTKTFLSLADAAPFGCRWLRRTSFIDTLELLSNPAK